MNEHPDQLLTDYVDGSLGAEDRARVEAHVRDCDRCRAEVDLAAAGRESLLAVGEVEPPPGLTFEVRRRARRPRGGMAWKVATGAAAAAVLAVGIVVSLGPPGGEGGGGGAGPTAERGFDAGAREPGAAVPQADQERQEAQSTLRNMAAVGPRYRETARDYDTATILAFGRRLRAEVRASLGSGFREPATEFYQDFELDRFPDEARLAAECLLREAPPDELVVPYLVERASFQGQPAFVGAFLQGPSRDEPYDRILLWVVERPGCTLRYFATVRL